MPCAACGVCPTCPLQASRPDGVLPSASTVPYTGNPSSNTPMRALLPLAAVIHTGSMGEGYCPDCCAWALYRAEARISKGRGDWGGGESDEGVAVAAAAASRGGRRHRHEGRYCTKK